MVRIAAVGRVRGRSPSHRSVGEEFCTDRTFALLCLSHRFRGVGMFSRAVTVAIWWSTFHATARFPASLSTGYGLCPIRSFPPPSPPFFFSPFTHGTFCQLPNWKGEVADPTLLEARRERASIS